jgi:TonB family protein
VALLSLRVWRHWRQLRALVRAAHAVPVWQERLRSLALGFGLQRGIRVLSSARVATPTLVGRFRPAILLPIAVSSGFPVEQVELILAHELAHLRRLDHFANLFQVVLETLLFYHPVVHWISRDVRNERELCCDALALRVTGGNRREFAIALVELEEFRERHAGLALAASGGVLLERIGQITGTNRNRAVRQPGRFVGAFSALLLATLLLAVLWRQAESRHEPPASAADVQSLLASPLLPATFRIPVQTIVNFAPRHIAISPALVVPVRAPAVAEATRESAPAGKLALAAPGIADLNPARLELASLAIPAPAAPTQDAPGVLTPVHIEQPAYPVGALEQDVEGKVVLDFAVNADGSVRDPQVVEAQPVGIFDRAATHALLGWKFAPPAGADTQRRYRQTFTFTLHADRDAAGREIQAKAGCYAVTGTHICRSHGLDQAYIGGGLR